MGVLKRVGSKCFVFCVLTVMLIVSIPSVGFAAPGSVTVDKTVSWVEEGKIAQVEMTVVNGGTTMNASDETRIVLVIDVSGSMGGSRLDSVKAAASTLVDDLLPAGTTDTSVQIAVVTFESTASTLIGFSNDGPVINSAIDSMVDLGGTFTQDGLYRARLLLDSVSATNKIIVLLSDGDANESYQVIGASGISWDGTSIVYDNPAITACDYTSTRTSSFQFVDNLNMYHSTGFPNGHDVPTLYEADLAKSTGTEIYSIAYQASSSAEGLMAGIATDSAHSYASTDAQLAFSSITASIQRTIYATQAKVTDAMGSGTIESLSYQFEIITNNPSYPISARKDGVETPGVATVDAIAHNLEWLLHDANGVFMPGVYELTYYVQLDATTPNMSGKELNVSNGAVLSFVDASGAGTALPFPLPILASRTAASGNGIPTTASGNAIPATASGNAIPATGDLASTGLQAAAFMLLLSGIAVFTARLLKERREID